MVILLTVLLSVLNSLPFKMYPVSSHSGKAAAVASVIHPFESTGKGFENPVIRQVQQLQKMQKEEPYKKYEMIMATEGLDFCLDKGSYKRGEGYILFVYSDKAIIKSGGRLQTLALVSNKETDSGFKLYFSNSTNKLVLSINKIRDLSESAGFDGWSSMEGDVTLYDSRNNVLHRVPYVYGEGA